MGDKNGFQVGTVMDMGIVVENRYEYVYGFLENGYEYRDGFLKSVPNCVPDLLVKGDKNMVKPTRKC